MQERIRLHRVCDKAKSKALYGFAALNGWLVGKHAATHPNAIGRRNREFLYSEYDLGLPGGPFCHFFDHAFSLRADSTNVAVLAQPYNHVDPDAYRRWFKSAASPSISPRTR